jgi:hypothetical protein
MEGEVTNPGGKLADDLSTIMAPVRQLPPESLPTFVLEVVDGPNRGLSMTLDDRSHRAPTSAKATSASSGSPIRKCRAVTGARPRQ